MPFLPRVRATPEIRFGNFGRLIVRAEVVPGTGGSTDVQQVRVINESGVPAHIKIESRIQPVVNREYVKPVGVGAIDAAAKLWTIRRDFGAMETLPDMEAELVAVSPSHGSILVEATAHARSSLKVPHPGDVVLPLNW